MSFAPPEDDLAWLRRLGFTPRLDDPETWEALQGAEGFVRERILAATDGTRVWNRDVECDPFPGEGEYVRWAEGMAAVCRGHLDGLRAEETWVGEPDMTEHPVVVTLRHRGRMRVFRPPWHGDYIASHAIAREVDAMLPRFGPRLHAVPTGGQDCWYVALTPRERRSLEARGWRFAEGGAGDEPSAAERVRAGLREAWDRFWWPFRA